MQMAQHRRSNALPLKFGEYTHFLEKKVFLV